jgi:hypothetical protein
LAVAFFDGQHCKGLNIVSREKIFLHIASTATLAIFLSPAFFLLNKSILPKKAQGYNDHV